MPMNMNLTRTASAAGAALLLGASAAAGQSALNQFNVGAHLGWTKYGSATALESAPFIGIDGTYRIPFGSANTDLGIGFTFGAARPVTRGDQFPVVAFDFGDTTFLYTVAQRVTMLTYGGQAVLGQTFGRLRAYALGGGGAYTIFLDARQNIGNESFAKGYASGGGGLEYAIARNVGVRFEARDLILLGYDRNRLDPSVGYSTDRRIGDVLPAPDATKRTVHNLQGSLVFSYLPNRRGRGGAEP
ncbi:MAG: outer membrane beta-barrel protein [Gemmatimonadaceae bacterium]